jgi:hypothetical protein
MVGKRKAEGCISTLSASNVDFKGYFTAISVWFKAALYCFAIWLAAAGVVL